MRTLDTNCLLRWLVRDHPAMTARMDVLMASGEHLRVPDAALIETVYVLENLYLFSRGEVAQVVRLLIGQATLDISRTLWAEIMDAYVVHPKLSCTDLFLAIDALYQEASPLISFDKKLINQMGAVSP